MQIIDNFVDTIKNFIAENKRSTVIITAVIAFLCASSLFLFIGKTLSLRQNKSGKPSPEAPLVITQPLFIPEGPVLPQGYVESRVPRQKWTETEIEQWFTVPDKKAVDELEKANDSFITDIVDSAP